MALGLEMHMYLSRLSFALAIDLKVILLLNKGTQFPLMPHREV